MSIIDLAKSYKTEVVGRTTFTVEGFTFDCTLDESHESRLIVTDNAMESGALSSDHSYLEPRTLSARGLVVSYKPFNLFPDSISSDLRFGKTLPFLTGVIGQTEQAIAKINRYAGKALRAIDTAQKAASQLAPWLPDSLASLGDRTTETLSRKNEYYEKLLTIQRSGELLNVSSGMKNYSNMLLTDVVAVSDNPDSAEFILRLREVFVVETRTVQGLVVNVPTAPVAKSPTSKPDGEKKTGRAAEQSAKPQSKGRTQPAKVEPKRSVAKSIGDIIRGI